MGFSSLYRARATQVNQVPKPDGSTVISVKVPAVFGEESILISDAIGSLPLSPEMGWVLFQAGNPEFPVWMGNTGLEGPPGPPGTGGSGTDEVWIGPDDPKPANPTIELWYDTDADAAASGYQPSDSDLTAIAALTPANNDVIQRKAGVWTNSTPATLKTDLGLSKADVGLGNVDNTSDVNKPVSTAQQAALDGKQPLDADLTTIAGLAATTDNIIQGFAGAWASRTPAQVKTALALDQVNNTSDANKPVSTAQQTALNLKADKATTIATTAPLTGGGDLSANRTLDISTFTATVKGAVPPPTTATGKFLKDDGTWAVPPTGGLTDGDKGDIIVGGSGTTLTIDNDVVTVAKISDVELKALGGLTSAVDTLPYFTGSGTAALLAFNSISRAVVSSSTLTNWRANLGLAIGTDIAAIRRPINADATTAFTPSSFYENSMVTLSNAGAITVTLPSNASFPMAIGTEVDFLWLGVGQPTFVAGSGATVNGTPGLKMRAQYSAATAKKISTNGWVVLGDLSA